MKILKIPGSLPSLARATFEKHAVEFDMITIDC
jgi:hypothetical protein